MKLPQFLPIEARPVVLLMAEPNGVAITLVEQFLANFCRVVVVSEKKDLWEKRTRHIGDNRGVEIFEPSEAGRANSNTSYIVFLSGAIEQTSGSKAIAEDKKKLFLLESLLARQATKTLLVLPLNESNNTRKRANALAVDFFQKNKGVVGIVFAGELLGARTHLSDNNTSTRMIRAALAGEPLLPRESTNIYYVSVGEFARETVKALFSFGVAGEKLAIFSSPITSEEFYKRLGALTPVANSPSRKHFSHSLAKYSKRSVVAENIQKVLTETIEWARSHPQKIEKRATQRKKKIVKKDTVVLKIRPRPFKKIDKHWSIISIALLLIIISPFLLLSLSGTSLYIAKNAFFSEKVNFAKSAVRASTLFAKASRTEIGFMSKIPLAGTLLKSSREFVEIVVSASEIFERGFDLGEDLLGLSSNILGKEEYDIFNYSEELSLELASLHQDIGFLQSEVSESPGTFGKFFKGVIDPTSIKEIRYQILQLGKIASDLPDLLGEIDPRVYFVLFQNNMELRPTGGFIGSYALVTFEGGHMASIEVQDVYTADGQLQGHVEPPRPIKDYLGEANWFLRDSNWDPDFPTSAERAEWFLGKELGVNVDGVIAVDMEFVKEAVGALGGIYVADFDKQLTAENLYEVTQYEAETDFFPGSRKKATFLSALARTLIGDVASAPSAKYPSLVASLKKSLDEKHIQVFFHKKNSQKAIANLAWDGSVYTPDCKGNCYADFTGIVEANVGVNKVNYFIEREAYLDVKIEETSIMRTLTLNLKNSAPAALGVNGRYKVYIRALAPLDANFSDVSVLAPNNEESLVPDVLRVSGRKEAGILVEVPPGNTKTVIFNWQTNKELSRKEEGEYKLVWRKQAGTLTTPSTVSVFSSGGELLASPEPFLTDGGQVVYNTDLARDFSSRVFW